MSEAKQPAQIQLTSGRSIPQLGLGTWRSDKGQVENAVRHAIEHGIRLIDCAFVYANQTEVGAGITKALQNLGGKVKREDLYVVSKLWNSQHHPDDIEAAVRKCLEELQLTYLDLYLVHWPTAFARGDNMFPKNEQGQFSTENIPLIDTWKALERLVDLGLVKDIGVSNYSTAEVDEVLAGARIKPVVNQVELHPYWPQTALAADMKARGLTVMAYSPLGNLGGADQPSVLDDPVVKAVAAEVNKSPAQVLIRWSLQKGHVCIPKSVSAGRIEQNFAVLDFEINADQLAKLDSLSAKNLRFVNPPFRAGGKPVF